MARIDGSSNDVGVALLRDTWGLTSTAFVVIALRVVAKLRIHKFGLDDILMIFAQVSISYFPPYCSVMLNSGFGRVSNG